MGVNQWDAIVVGTGMSGGWAMRVLTEAGLKTLALDRGRMVEHGDYPTEHKQPWNMPWRDGRVHPDDRKDYPIQSRTYAFSEYARHWFIKDTDAPYAQDQPFDWIQPDVVGGKALIWGRQSYRWSPMDFEANQRDGHGVDWPIRYEDLEPWYDLVEQTIGVSGARDGIPQLPDGVFQKPMDMNAAEKAARDRIEATFPGRRVIIGRAAVLTEPLDGRAPCHYCGPCMRGCSTGSYYSTQSSALPAARATGNLTLLARKLVHSVTYAEGRATGVRVIDMETGAFEEHTARLVFLCASAPGTVRIMLNSKSPEFPGGIANSSSVLGHYLLNHHARVGAGGEMEGMEDRYWRGNRPNGIYVPRFRNLGGDRRPDYVRGFGMQGGASRSGWARGGSMRGTGAAFKAALRVPGGWRIGLQAYGEVLPYHENYMTLDDELTDKWGMPAVRFHVGRFDNELAMRKDMAATAAEMLEASGARNVTTYNNAEIAPGNTNHEMGGARMGRDPRTSVLNGWNQCHDVPNLFVTDGACMTSSACQNPSLTYMALTARAANYAIDQLKTGTL
ncbi:MAG: GMC family oxidoreductase [Rhodothermales bacterium]|nr:GMC family oxidoreductase [Rhodothermales bacterium]